MKKRVIAFVLILALILSLTACGKKEKSLPEQIEKTIHDSMLHFTIPSQLEEFECEEETDGLYLSCKLKYTNSWEKFTALSLHDFLDDLFSEYKEIESVLLVCQGLNDEHVYNCLYVRDGDTYEIVDELEVY